MPSLLKISVNLIPRAVGALRDAVRITGDNNTDTMNRAIQVYAFLVHMKQNGCRIVVVDPQGREKEVEFL